MCRFLIASLLACGVSTACFAAPETLSPNLSIESGPVNAVLIGTGEAAVAVYSAPPGRDVSTVLLTHHRRDVVTSALPALNRGAKAIAPEAERVLLESPQTFWSDFWTKRFHDYAQQSTRILTQPVPVAEWVHEGDRFERAGVTFEVLDTPGLTRGAVSYLATIDGRKVAFTGDLIYGDGKLLDLYSFQDEIPEARIGGYHGHASRLALLIPSLKKIAAANPDVLIPARGPLITTPQASIQKLIDRVQAYYRNYTSTNALNWYFKEERMTIKGRRVLGENAEVPLMPYSLYQETPDWIWENSTSRLLISDDGHGFLLDCGYQRVIDGIKQLMADGLVKQVDGIFVTHYHDDHTNLVQAAATEFGCPVYSTPEYEDILERPGAYHMPATTDNPVKDVTPMKNGQKLKWKEYELEFRFYPGQTLYHGALLVRRSGGTPVFFVGDAFSPSGMDDYCLLNRNLLHDDSGYLFCLKSIRELGNDYWLINEHIPHIFRFSPTELDFQESQLRKRIEIIRELSPWDDPNYMIDEQWAVCYPRATSARVGETVEMEIRLLNHSPVERTLRITARVTDGAEVSLEPVELKLAPRESKVIRVPVKLVRAGNHVLTADIESDGLSFRDWADGLIQATE